MKHALVTAIASIVITACSSSSSTPRSDMDRGGPLTPDAAAQGSNSGTLADAAPPPVNTTRFDGAAAAASGDSASSVCGKPGDLGNDLGVGKYCTTLTDCLGNNKALLCSNLGDSSTFFCTKLCSKGSGATECGANATCSCNAQNQCGCAPNACLK